jgi:hypothetical protein
MAQRYWYCAFCHTGNHPAGDFCGSCGNPRPEPSFFSKLTPALLIAGGILFAAGMIFGAIVGELSRSPAPEARALQLSSQSTIPIVPSPTDSPVPTSTLPEKRRTPTPTPTPSPSPFAAEELDIPYSAPAESASVAKESSRSGSNGYILGPRGGCYYINSGGNKTYVERSLCGAESSLPPAYLATPKSSSSKYIRGPRGGCYYINSGGNKSYVDRSLCD